VDLNEKALDKVTIECKNAGAEVLPLLFDLSILENSAKAIQKTVEHFQSNDEKKRNYNNL